MHLNKTNATSIDGRITKYKGLPLRQLQLIQPQWAYGDRINLLLDKSLHPDNKEYEICLINTIAFVKVAVFSEVNMKKLFTDELLNDGRIASIFDRWSMEQVTDPPTIYLSQHPDCRIYFSDGRHRTKLAYFLGHPQLPVAIPIVDLARLRDHVAIH